MEKVVIQRKNNEDPGHKDTQGDKTGQIISRLAAKRDLEKSLKNSTSLHYDHQAMVVYLSSTFL